MDHPELATTRRHVGELGTMADQTQRAERQILERAETLLAEVEERIQQGRAGAQSGDDEASKQYQADIEERGRLQVVIAQAREHLGEG